MLTTIQKVMTSIECAVCSYINCLDSYHYVKNGKRITLCFDGKTLDLALQAST